MNDLFIILRDEENIPIRITRINESNLNRDVQSFHREDLEILSLDNLELDDYKKKKFRVKTGILKWEKMVFKYKTDGIITYGYKFHEAKINMVNGDVSINKIVVENRYSDFEVTLKINFCNKVILKTINYSSHYTSLDLFQGINEINVFLKSIKAGGAFEIDKIDLKTFFIKRNYDVWYWISSIFSVLKFDYYKHYYFDTKEREYQYSEYLDIGRVDSIPVPIKALFLSFMTDTLGDIKLEMVMLNNGILRITGDIDCFYSHQNHSLNDTVQLLSIDTYFRNDKFGHLRDYLVMEFTKCINPRKIIEEIVLHNNE